jgi:hypothetical protein
MILSAFEKLVFHCQFPRLIIGIFEFRGTPEKNGGWGKVGK